MIYDDMDFDDPAQFGHVNKNTVRIVIPWAQVPKARARVTRQGTYDPKARETIRDRRFLMWIVAGMPQIRILKDLGGVKSVRMDFVLQIPKSLSTVKRKALEGKAHDKKPDLSNLAKQTEDVGNGILWRDDAIIHTATWRKTWGEDPKTIIEIEYEERPFS